MELEDLLAAMNRGERTEGSSSLHEVMHRTSQDALRITGELNTGYQEPARIRELLSELTGTEVQDSVTLFPPLSSDFGKNLRIGKNVFINSGCRRRAEHARHAQRHPGRIPSGMPGHAVA